MLAYIISESARGLAGVKEPSGHTVSDFVPKWWTDEEREEADKQQNLVAKAKATFIGLGGKPSGR